MIKLIMQFATAMSKGKELNNSSAWKNASTVAGVFGAFLAVGVSLLRIYYPEVAAQISDKDIVEASGFLAGGVMAVMGLINIVTSKKVGLPKDK